MANTYKTLFRIRIGHNYYENGITSDFSIVALPQTQKLAQQYKLLFKPVANGIDVLSLMTGESTPFLDLGDRNKLSFAMMLHNTNLLNITRLPVRQSSRQVYHIENTPEAGTSIGGGKWKLVTPKTTRFTHSRQSGANEISLRCTGPFGDAQTSDMVKDGNRFISTFDLGNQPEGKYLLEATEDGELKEAEAIYTSEFLWKTRPFALIDIFTNELSYNSEKKYTIKLKAEWVNWTYCVNLGKDYTGSTISIQDQRELSEVFFKLVGNKDQAIGKTLKFQLYKINEPNQTGKIRLNERPISDFNLIIEKNGTKTEIKGLPNPAIDQVKTEMHINI